MTSTQSEGLFWLAMLNPANLLTALALAAIVLTVEGKKEITLHELWWEVLLAVLIPLFLWSALSHGMKFPVWVQVAGVFVITAAVLRIQNGFSLLGATLAATVLVVVDLVGRALTDHLVKAGFGALMRM